jgi:hypothetical protein
VVLLVNLTRNGLKGSSCRRFNKSWGDITDILAANALFGHFFPGPFRSDKFTAFVPLIR